MVITEKQDVVLLELKGRLLQSNTEELEMKLFSFYKKDKAQTLLIDLSQVSHISSSILGILVAMRSQMQKKGGDIVLIITRKDILTLFETTRLIKIFEIYKQRDIALSAFGI